MTGARHRNRLGRLFLSSRHRLLHHGVPLTARRAPAQPLRALISTLLAEPHCLSLYCRHISFFYINKDIKKVRGLDGPGLLLLKI